jgi:hypothetical protein
MNASLNQQNSDEYTPMMRDEPLFEEIKED